MNISELIRYGEIVEDEELFSMCAEYADNVRITIFHYKGEIYYTKRINGEVEVCDLIGFDYEKQKEEK